MKILGLNAYHADAAAALVIDGRVVAAAEEERFRRVKHWAGLPSEAVAWCLEEAGLTPSELDAVAVNRDPKANLLRKLRHVIRHRPDISFLLDRFRNQDSVVGVVDSLTEAEPSWRAFSGEVDQVEHHLAHQASSFLVSPFEEAALLSVDGFGDFASTSWGRGEGTKIEFDGKVFFPHSLGAFYLTMTQYLGFPRYGDEYRVMGLAPYGEPCYMDEMREIVRSRRDGTFELDLRFFRHHNEDLDFHWEEGSPTVGSHFTDDLEALLGPARDPEEDLTDRHRDLARSVQARFEECFLDLLTMLHELHPVDALCLSGGAAMNSVANGKVIPSTPFREVYVPPAPGDAGGAIGAALVAWDGRTGGQRPEPIDHSFLGQRFDVASYEAALEGDRDELQEQGCSLVRAESDEELCTVVARSIQDGEVVGWFQGRMEFGPRALGNRSILCDPRREDMRDTINRRIKLREPFRPFAPSVLRSGMAEWFEVDDDVPFMMKVYPIREERRREVPAVTHVDGTGRPQTVTPEQNPLYHRVIERFAAETGVPMVLNTSFNENEPIVHRPEEALDCFLRTDMDLLVLGPYLVRKRADEKIAGSAPGAKEADGF